jgi:3D (Asp-Asp-Asp) domain-containing protein
MQRHALPVLILALAVALPARASQTHHHTSATAAAPIAALPRPVGKTVFSSKGSRLEAQMSPATSAKADKTKIADHAKKAAPDTAKVAAAPNAPAAANPVVQGRLARLTAYWTDEDYWTSQHMSSTGARLQKGYCAVDPKLIPYGSVVQIPGMGPYLAVDTGSAVVSRQAALGSAQTPGQRQALVVDLFFENEKEARQFANHGPRGRPAQADAYLRTGQRTRVGRLAPAAEFPPTAVVAPVEGSMLQFDGFIWHRAVTVP